MEEDSGDGEDFFLLGDEGRLHRKHSVRGKKKGCTRVVAISDTHNVQDAIHLPMGDVLVHAGDILTESGRRHVVKDRGGNNGDFLAEIKNHGVAAPGVAKESGVALFEQFASWFCAQPHPHKCLIGGNHDGVLEVLGAEKVREILDRHSTVPGSVVYLVHETATVGELKVFGSPYGHWGSHNDAFSRGPEHSYDVIEPGTDIIVTHSPPILPGGKRGHAQREHKDIVEAAVKCGAKLSVSGHCHWAFGAYRSETFPSKLPFVVASSCDSKWERLSNLEGTRLDKKWDFLRGGYNIRFRPIVVDIKVKPPPSGELWKLKK